MLSGEKMAPVVRKLFEIRDSYFDTNIISLGVLPSMGDTT